MTRRIFSFDRPDRFVAGAIGEPGHRIFFLQAAKGEQVVSVALEKAQVAVLAERLAVLLLALRETGVALGEQPDSAAPKLDEPVIEQFRVGTLTIGWDGDAERIVIEAREITDEDEDEDDDPDDEVDEPAPPPSPFMAGDLGDGPSLVRVKLAPSAAHAFASGASAVVRAGRPLCPQCGAPLDPTGHFCPRSNGFAH